MHIGNWWLKREDVEGIARSLGIAVVPIVGQGTLEELVEYIREGHKSLIAENLDYIMEGVVARPAIEMFGRDGKRIITKLKHKDFR